MAQIYLHQALVGGRTYLAPAAPPATQPAGYVDVPSSRTVNFDGGTNRVDFSGGTNRVNF